MQQLLSGLDHCHNRGVLHQDIKGANLLLDNNGILKIAYFGLATFFNPKQKQHLTSRVVTLWYEPSELLLGATNYGAVVDLWSVGCILAELLSGKPIMLGRTEVEQLHNIFKLCGSPSEEFWANLKLSRATIFKPQHPYHRCVNDNLGIGVPLHPPLTVNLVGYPYLPQNYYLPSAPFQQAYSSNGPFHQSAAPAVPGAGMKYPMPQYKSSPPASTLPQPSSLSGYGGFGSANNIPGNFSQNQGAAAAPTTLGFDEALGTQFKHPNHYAALQQSDNSAMWLHGGAGSRTISAVPPGNFYGFQGQSQHGGFR
ncbi:hypothetical protein ZEAMMB73_Zm00001d004950 [Zea mays]|uniref:Uncharacterized protein n=1 Tax=Zea mays TaxID=4577 RepID=A0A1D6EI96_MAIZE|nr:hypothetical protein ZEAMMB73_Zm00001d004950 [Zea mays]